LVYRIDECSCPIFTEIQFIIIYQNIPVFICSSLVKIGFNYNIGSFEVKQNTKCQLNMIYLILSLFVFTGTGERYVILHHPV